METHTQECTRTHTNARSRMCALMQTKKAHARAYIWAHTHTPAHKRACTHAHSGANKHMSLKMHPICTH